MKEQLKHTGTKTLIGRGCLIVLGILFLLFLYRYNQIDKVTLYETGGRNFVKAKVTKIITDNEKQSGVYIGDQTVQVKGKEKYWKQPALPAICLARIVRWERE